MFVYLNQLTVNIIIAENAIYTLISKIDGIVHRNSKLMKSLISEEEINI